MAKIRRMQGYNPTNFTNGNRPVDEEDYIYALEVAGQPAVTARERAIKEQAQQDVKYLEAKYPSIASKFKLFGDRIQNTEPMKSINKKQNKKVSGSH